MDTKVILFVAALSATTGCSAQSVRTYSDKELLENYALTKCIGMTHNSVELKKDADASAQGYLEFGNVDFQAYEDAIALASSFLNRSYDSKSGAPLNVMKCIDMYHSRELDVLVEKYVSQK